MDNTNRQESWFYQFPVSLPKAQNPKQEISEVFILLILFILSLSYRFLNYIDESLPYPQIKEGIITITFHFCFLMTITIVLEILIHRREIQELGISKPLNYRLSVFVVIIGFFFGFLKYLNGGGEVRSVSTFIW